MGPMEQQQIELIKEVQNRLRNPPALAIINKKLELTVSDLESTINSLRIKIKELERVIALEGSNVADMVQKYEGRIQYLEIELMLASTRIKRLTPTTLEVQLQDIMDIVSTKENISITELKSRRQKHSVCFVKHICCYLMALHTKAGFPVISRFMEYGDHTTSLYARDKIRDLRAKDPALDEKLKGYESLFIKKQE